MTTRTLGKQNEVRLERGTSGAARSRLATLIPSALWIAAAALILASLALPYWGMTLQAPQYPGGLTMRVFVNRMTGDADPRLDEVREIDGLNHYIGMAPLRDAAAIERQLAPIAMTVIVLLVGATAFIHRKWFAPMTVPAILLPAIFLGDMYYWLRRYGQGLDPRAALSNAVKPFTPTLLGRGEIGQFSTDAGVGLGFWMAATASALILVALHYRRAARRSATAEMDAGR